MEIRRCQVNERLQQSSCKVIVNVNGKQEEGSGWLCSNCGHIITAGHLFLEDKHELVEDVCVNVEVHFVGYEPVKTFILTAHRDDNLGIDFAILKMEKIHKELQPFLIDFSLGIGQEVIIYGFGTNFSQTSTATYGKYEGEAISMDGDSYWLKINAQNAVQRGYSGSAVVSTISEAVVGIQTDASTIKFGADSSTIFAMPIKRILELYPSLYNFVSLTSSKFSVYNMKNQVLLYRSRRQEENELFFDERIDTRILPSVLDFEEKKPTLNKAFLDKLWELNGGSCFILGEEGGCGKTVTLLKCFNRILCKDSPLEVPFYIELKNLPDIMKNLKFLKPGNIIAYYIASEYLGSCNFEDKFLNEFDTIIGELRNPIIEGTRYILLLDGLNEVPIAFRQNICNEILYWEKFNHIQLIVTSRYYENILISECKMTQSNYLYYEDDDMVENQKLKLLKISELDEEVVFEYLTSCKFSQNIMAQIKEKRSLISILKIPMFLIFFSRLTENNILSGLSMISTRGEVLAAFFSRKKQDLKKDILKIENQNINQYKHLIKRYELTSESPLLKQQYFILDFIIPYIAFYLSKTRRYQLDREEFKKILSDLFKKDSFMMQRERKTENYRPLRELLNDWSNNVGAYQIDDCVDAIIDFITKELCVMKKINNLRENVDIYEFLHEHLRDYFAAVQLREDIRYYVVDDQNSFSSLAYPNIPDTVLEFFGEICGEHNCKPICDTNEHCWKYPGDSYIINILHNLKKKHDMRSQVIVANIMKTLKYSRDGDLSGLDFSDLDFSQSWLGGIQFCRWYDNTYYASRFDGATIQARNFFRMGHNCRITKILENERDRNIIYSGDILGIIKIWDVSSKNCKTLKVSEEAIRDLMIDWDNMCLIIASIHHIYSMELISHKIRAIMDTNDYICKIKFDINHNLLYCNDFNQLLWYHIDGSEASIKYQISVLSADACITQNHKTILISGKSKNSRILLYKFNEDIHKWPDSPNFTQAIDNGKKVNCLCLSRDETCLLVAIGSYLYEFSLDDDGILREVMQMKAGSICSYATYSYDHNGNRDGIVFSNGYSIQKIDNNKELFWTLSEGNDKSCFCIPFIAKEDYSTIYSSIPVGIKERYLIITNQYVQEFDAETNVCDKIYPKSGSCLPGYRISDNKMYIFTNKTNMISFENGLQLKRPLVDYKLYDYIQMRESMSFTVINLGNKIAVFDRNSGECDEFEVFDGLMIQHCSMHNLKGEMAQPDYKEILRRYGAETEGEDRYVYL